MARPAPQRSRLLVIAPQPFYEDSGTPIALRHFLEALSELGQQVDLLTYPVGEDLCIPGLRVFRIRNPLGIRTVPIGLSFAKLVLDATLIGAVFHRLRCERYHTVHAVEEAIFPAIWAARRRGVPVVYDMQSSLPEQLADYKLLCLSGVQRWLQARERWAIRRSSAIVCSAGLVDRVRSIDASIPINEWLFAAGKSDAHSDAHSVEKLRDELDLPHPARIVVYSGNFAAYQGLSVLMDAVPRVLSAVPEARFVLVGSNEAGREWQARAAMLSGQGVLRLVPRQPRERIPGYLALADVLVSPRIAGNNLPLKVFDYMAAGRPIVATDSASHRRVLDDERACFVRPGAGELAEGIAGLLLDRPRAERLAVRARAYHDAHMSWWKFVEFVSSIYPQGRAGGPAGNESAPSTAEPRLETVP